MSFFLNTTVCGFSLYHILAFFLIYSCLGWCVEVVYAAATTGQLVNRGFLNGPVCPIYGFGMILVLFFLTPLEDNLLLLYLGGVILPSALELVGGWALYKLYRTRWWDYTDKPFNIGGYVCLEFSLMWGVGAMVMVKAIHPTIAALVNIIPPLVGFVLICLLYAVYAADVVATAIAASDLARELDALEKVADSMHAVSDAMTEILGTTALDMDQKMDECAIGYTPGDFSIDKVCVWLSSKAGEVYVCENAAYHPYSEDEAAKVLAEHDILVKVDMGTGDASAKAWGCDLTYDYVKINGDYRT